MRRQRVLHRMRYFGNTRQSDDTRRALERMGLPEEACHWFRACVAPFKAEDIA